MALMGLRCVGMETGQVIGTQVFPFDDAEVARECAA
jgi:UDP-N-acetylmuramyl tripeptide synthase